MFTYKDGTKVTLPGGPTRMRKNEDGVWVIEAQDGSWSVPLNSQQAEQKSEDALIVPLRPAPALPENPVVAGYYGWSQGSVNLLYGTQRASYSFADGMVNGFFGGDTSWLNGQDSFTVGVPHDWARNLVAPESDRGHYWSTTIGGESAFVLLIGKVVGLATSAAEAASSSRVASSTTSTSYLIFQSEADAMAHRAYASRGFTPNGMKVQIDKGVRGSINLQEGNILYREAVLDAGKVSRVRPFSQALSDTGGQPIRAVVTSDGKVYLMQGNHRVYGATADQLKSVEGVLYTPEQWESFTGMRFNPSLGTPNPQVR